MTDIRAILSLVILLGSGVLLVLDGHLVDQFAGQLMATDALIVAYWFGTAASLPARAPDPTPQPPQNGDPPHVS